MQQRRLRDALPSRFRNSDLQQEDIRQELTNRRLEQKNYQNRGVRELPPLWLMKNATQCSAGLCSGSMLLNKHVRGGGYCVQV